MKLGLILSNLSLPKNTILQERFIYLTILSHSLERINMAQDGTSLEQELEQKVPKPVFGWIPVEGEEGLFVGEPFARRPVTSCDRPNPIQDMDIFGTDVKRFSTYSLGFVAVTICSSFLANAGARYLGWGSEYVNPMLYAATYSAVFPVIMVGLCRMNIREAVLYLPTVFSGSGFGASLANLV